MNRNRDGVLALIAMMIFFVMIMVIGFSRGSLPIPAERDLATLEVFQK
jgi:hypothetical protein